MMRQIFFFICLWCVVSGSAEAVTLGIQDIEQYRALLVGKKVGIVANQTSVLKNHLSDFPEMVHSVDFLRQHEIQLVRIFCPEHGFRGDADAGELVGNYQDKETGLPVVSLYGKNKKPTPEDLQGIDIVIFDMQDVGVRFYTYLSTLHYVMEACAENHLPLIVMDRPNPNAFYVDGPVLDMKYSSFVGMHPVPIVYGMTMGEYAQMINGEGWLKDQKRCDLTVIPCQDWHRDMTVDLPRRPSPNLPDKVSVMLYPSVCLFEGTVVSEGRGTHTPFQVFGHPELKNMPYSFVPESIPGMSKSPKCQGKKCYGMDLRDKYTEVKSGERLRIDWLIRAYQSYTGKSPFFISYFENLAGTDQLRKDIQAGKSEEQIRAAWLPGLQQFQKIREKYLIYK